MVSKEISDCWIISSGLIGCENQCIGLAEELNLKYEIKRVNPSKLFIYDCAFW
jgi:mitochondrial fission protein ELM1